MQPLTDVVKNLIIINVIIFIGTMGLDAYYKDMGHLYFFKSDKFQPFQLVTSMFMHSGFQHLLFNMMSLFFLGPAVERVLGSKRFFTLYLIAGFTATLAHWGMDYVSYRNLVGSITAENIGLILSEGQDLILNGKNYSEPLLGGQNLSYYYLMNTGALGASGAIYGVVIAFITMFPNQRMMVFPIPFPIKAVFLGIGLVVVGIVSGVGSLQPGIGHYAHLGGALAGFLLTLYWNKANLH